MRAYVNVTRWVYPALIMTALLVPVYCMAEEPKHIGEPATVVDEKNGTITMSLELWNGVMERMKAQDDYIKIDREKLKKEIEADTDKKHCI